MSRASIGVFLGFILTFATNAAQHMLQAALAALAALAACAALPQPIAAKLSTGTSKRAVGAIRRALGKVVTVCVFLMIVATYAFGGTFIGSAPPSYVFIDFIDDQYPTITLDPVAPRIALKPVGTNAPVIKVAVQTSMGWRVDISDLVASNLVFDAAGWVPGGPTTVLVEGTVVAELDLAPMWVPVVPTPAASLSEIQVGTTSAALTLRALWAEGQTASGAVAEFLASELSVVTIN